MFSKLRHSLPSRRTRGLLLTSGSLLVFGGLGFGSIALAEADVAGRGGGQLLGEGPVGTIVLGGHGIIRSSRALGTFALNSVDYKISSLQNIIKGRRKKTQDHAKAQSEIHRRSAERLLRLCESNRGIYIKAGQFVASLQQLPKEYTTTLAVLQDQARGRPFRVIDRVFKEEFGCSASQIFSEFEETPMAAASLAQVHRARLHSGEEVAVKIQYPGLETQVETDIKTMALLSKAVAWLFPDYQFNWIVPQFEENLAQQLDFRREGSNAEVTAENFQHKEEVKVPRIFWSFTSRRVLTMEFMKGCKIDDVEGIRHQGLDPHQVAALLVEAFAEMAFCHGHLHGDPHPGNILVQANPRKKGRKFDLVLLDHGLYRELDDDFRRNFCRLWRALIFTDANGVHEMGQALGAGEFSKFLPVLFTSRPFESKSSWGHRMTPDEERQIKSEMKEMNLSTLSAVIEGLPKDLFLVMRTDNLVRQHVSRLGVPPRQRLFINGRYAIKGLAMAHAKDAKDAANELKPISMLARIAAHIDFLHLVLRVRASELLFEAKLKILDWIDVLRRLQDRFLSILLSSRTITL